jgi:hypothetical protein
MNAKGLDMVARLGKALFWAECAVASVVVAGFIYYGWIGRGARHLWRSLIG